MHDLTRRTILGAGAALLTGRPTFLHAQASVRRVFVGTFTHALGADVPDYFVGRAPVDVSRGLYTFIFDTATGRAGDISLAAEVSNPFTLTVHSNGTRALCLPLTHADRWTERHHGVRW